MMIKKYNKTLNFLVFVILGEVFFGKILMMVFVILGDFFLVRY
jgi:hypothetical protein